jgi:hypothetical protein
MFLIFLSQLIFDIMKHIKFEMLQLKYLYALFFECIADQVSVKSFIAPLPNLPSSENKIKSTVELLQLKVYDSIKYVKMIIMLHCNIIPLAMTLTFSKMRIKIWNANIKFNGEIEYFLKQTISIVFALETICITFKIS